jgi:hypothetical protein
VTNINKGTLVRFLRSSLSRPAVYKGECGIIVESRVINYPISELLDSYRIKIMNSTGELRTFTGHKSEILNWIEVLGCV